MKQKLVVLTGAGVSAESGISTFRDNGGLWDNYDPQQVASIEGWYKNPGLMLDFYNIRRHTNLCSCNNFTSTVISKFYLSFFFPCYAIEQ